MEPFLTADEVAELLKFPPGKSGVAGRVRVYALHHSGRLRGVRLGRSLRWPPAAVERLAEEADAT